MKKKFISKLLVFAMSVSLLSGVSQPVFADTAGGQNATISGTLLAADGTALADKTVTLRERSANDKSGRYTVTTDAEGKYTASVPAGVYQVLGIPYAFDSGKTKGTANKDDVCAVAQVVTADDGAEVKQDLQVPAPVEVPNGECDLGTAEQPVMTNWTFGGNSTGKYRSNNGDRHSGAGHLNIWKSSDFKVDVSQQLTNLEEGTYTLQLAAEAGVADNDEAYVYVKDADGSILAREEIRTTPDNQYEIFGLTVEVTDGPVTVGIEGNCTGGMWLNVDEIRMGKLPDAPVVYTKEQLKTLLDTANTYTAEDYTAVSFETLTTAKTNAQTVYEKADAAETEITQAYKALEEAIEALVPARKEGDADIQNDIFWRDTDGNVIYSQGGGIFQFGDTYYWYGVKYDEAEKYAKNPAAGPYSTDPSPEFVGVTCYTSKDLVSWKYEGLVVDREEVSERPEMNNQEVAWVGRLGVAKVGDKYALLVQHECPDEDNSLDGNIDTDQFSKQVLVLTSDTPDGKFTWNQRINMKDYTGGTSNTGDQTVFTDDDGTSYLVYSYGSGRGRIFLSKIVAQEGGKIGLAPSHKIYQGAGREGNCMFKYNDKYYVCASDLYGWNASHAYYMVLDSLEDSYLDSFTAATKMELMDGSSDDFCHVTQTGFFYTVQGSEQETVIFCGDRWADFAGNGLGYNQWCPLSFKADGTPCFNSLSAWNLDLATGKWTVHASNNYVKNGSFDADRVDLKELAGWTNTIQGGNSPISNNKDKVTGKYALKLGDAADFDCKVSQVIAQDTATADAVALPDGTYNLTAKVKNSGTFDELSMYAKSGSLTKKALINQAHTAYTEVTLQDVTVTGGKAEIGFIAKGKANASALVDDVTFVRSGEQTADTESIKVPITSDVAKDVTVTVASEDGTVAYVYEGKLESGTGTYTVSPVKAGTYTVTVAVNSCMIEGATQTVTVTAGQEAQVPAVTVTNQGGNVTGKVVDGKGAGIAGVTVTLTKGGDVIQATTGADGTFTVSDILAGKYTVQIEKEGYVSPEQTEVTVTVGGTATVEQQTMQSAMGTITGTVRDKAGAVVADATVTLRGCKTKASDKRYTIKTGADGTYSIQVIEDTYQVLAAKGGVNVQGVSDKVTVVRNETYVANLVIPEAVTVPNGDFENALNADTDWTNTGSAGKQTTRAADVLSGKGGYNIWSENNFTVELKQTLRNLENGFYAVNVKADSTFKAEDELYIYAKDATGKLLAREDIPSISVNSKGEVIGLVAEVKDGTLTIGISGNMTGGAWSHVDDFCVGKMAIDSTGGGDDDKDKEDKEAADAVIELINSIGTVDGSADSKAKIEAAREAYNKLSAAQKALVTNFNTLTAAEEKYQEIITSKPPITTEDKIDISKATVAAIPAQIYDNGKEITPAVSVAYGGKALVKDTDYKLTYANNKNIGTATVTIGGIGKYEKSLTKNFTITVKKNGTYLVGSYKYKITNAKLDGKGTVTVVGGKSKSLKSVKIGATVKIGGKSFKITSVGKNAFKGYKKLTGVTIGKNVTKIESGAFQQCAKLKKIKISSTALKSVGKNAIKGINKKAIIQCPKSKLAKYKKLFKSSTGYKKTMKIKK